MATQTWNIDPTHSTVGFTVRHMVFAKVRGTFKTFSGSVTFEEGNVASLVAVAEIEAASIDTGVADRDNHLRSADFFDAETHDKLTFRSTSVEGSGDKYVVTGDLTIRGETNPVTLDVEYAGQARDPWGKQRVAFEATGSLNRTDYGLKWNQALEAGGVLVGEKVELNIEVQAVKAE